MTSSRDMGSIEVRNVELMICSSILGIKSLNAKYLASNRTPGKIKLEILKYFVYQLRLYYVQHFLLSV